MIRFDGVGFRFGGASERPWVLSDFDLRIGNGEFPVASPEQRSWELCRECPALGRLCAGPATDA